MKKIKRALIFVIFAAAFLLIYNNADFGCKILKIVSPVEYIIDFNKNLILDEKENFIFNDLFYIDEQKDYSDDEILKNLTDNEKFYLHASADSFAGKVLKNRFVKPGADDILLNGNSVRKKLLDSGFFFSDTPESKRNLVENIKKINVEDYVIYNAKTGKIHKIGCEKGRKSRKLLFVKRTEIGGETKECPFCFGKQYKSKKRFIPVSAKSASSGEVYSEGAIKVYFMNPNGIYKPSKNCTSEVCRDLKREIDNAVSTIDMAVYGIDKQPEIFSALVNAQKRGVKIRAVFDYDEKDESYYPDTVELKKYITDFTTDEKYDKSGQKAIMHNKFFIFDSEKVWTGSANISNTGISGFNANIVLLITSKKIAEIYTREFNMMHDGKFRKDKEKIPVKRIKTDENTFITPLFSPQDNIINNVLVREINRAKEYVYIPVFFITNKQLIEPLINAKKRGVDVRIINDATNASNKYSIHKTLRENGIRVKTENYAGKMHIKSAIIDDKVTITGSMNFTKNGANRNDENVLLIESSEITKIFKKYFLIMWNDIPDKYETIDVGAESIYSTGSCSDGVDNDYDGKIDAADEGCSKR